MRLACLALAVFLVPLGAQNRGKQQKPQLPAPDRANVVYGPHERNVLDFWKAKSDRPTPLVIYIHGGGFTQGSKETVNPLLLSGCLSRGISVAAINYCYSTQAPYPAPMMDSAHAVQFLRLHAAEWNLDPRAFGATGGSAGAGISLWIGFHDDLADPNSAEPLGRQSTRLSAMAVTNAQSAYDPRTVAKLVGEETGRISALRRLFDVSEADPFTATRRFAAYEDGSPITHLSAGDPPVLMIYTGSNVPLPPPTTSIGIHHPRFGYFLKERMDKLGIECTVRIKDDYEGKPVSQQQSDMVEFFARHLLKGSPAPGR